MFVAVWSPLFLPGCGEDGDTYEEQKAALEAADRERERQREELDTFKAVISSAGWLIDDDEKEEWIFAVDGTVNHRLWQATTGNDGFWIRWLGDYTVRHGDDPGTFFITCSFDWKKWERDRNSLEESVDERMTLDARKGFDPWIVVIEDKFYREQ